MLAGALLSIFKTQKGKAGSPWYIMSLTAQGLGHSPASHGWQGAQEGSIQVEIGGLHQAAIVQRASWRHPDDHLQQICTVNQLHESSKGHGRRHI